MSVEDCAVVGEVLLFCNYNGALLNGIVKIILLEVSLC